MTTQTVKSLDESSLIGNPSNSPTSSPSNIIYGEFSTRPLPLPDTKTLASIISGYETDPIKAEYLAKARKKYAEDYYANEPKTLTSLRLAAGISQAQLAIKVGTSQPHIARIERGQNDPGTEMIARIASALNKNGTQIFSAIRNQLTTRGTTE